jgi:D-alanyl-D-alanine carboxypeptidase/D-alanyl-D-alanine-endopeptidase (penicillin-binding protein 4)
LSVSQPTALAPAVESIVRGIDYQYSHWGALLVDRGSGEVLQELDADKLFQPASVTKLFSCAAALEVLGPNYRFRTRVIRRGTVDDKGVLAGDLVLVASGDPTLGGRTNEKGELQFTDADHTYESTAKLTSVDPLAGLDALSRQVYAAGVRQVTGQIIVDDRLFPPGESTGSGPSRVSPICINDNVIDIIIVAGKPGEPAQVDWRPKSKRINVDADVLTVEPKEREKVTVQAHVGGMITVRGTCKAAETPEKPRQIVRIVEVEEPATYARGLFVESLQRAGVRTQASIGELNPSLSALPTTFAKDEELAALESPPFSENVRLILKVSHNLHASELPILLGSTLGKPTVDDGLRRQCDVFKEWGLDVGTMSFGGGAGGSPADLVTPRATAALLRHMAGHQHFKAYERALPVIGVDGTLADAVDKGSQAAGRVRAKTGTYWWQDSLNDRKILTSKALAGYITARSGRELVFALFVNRVPMKSADDRQKVAKTLGKITEIWMQSY